ncbi:hypothetical protein GCM10010417_35220 [Streptomyces carpaticus]
MVSEHEYQHEQLYQYEITAAMNHEVRACHEIVREHSHRDFWTPTPIPELTCTSASSKLPAATS